MNHVPEAEAEDDERDRVVGALRLLDRVPPAAYLREWTERIATAQRETNIDTLAALIFRLDDEWLALPAHLFQEVAENPPLHTLPHRRNEVVAGLVSIRGELLICASLAAVLGLEQAAGRPAHRPDRYRRVLVADRPEGRITFPVDEVAAVHRYHPSELLPLPATLGEHRLNYCTGLLPWGGKMVGSLDEEMLFRALERSLS